MSSPRVIVVGAGVGGLVLARALARAGRAVTVLEATDAPGGQLRRHRVGGIELDAGAESFATRGGAVAALAEDLGLGEAIVAPSPAGAWLQRAEGAAVPLPATSMLGIPGVPLASDVIAAIGGGSALRAYLEALLPGTVGAKSETLGELVRRRMGRGVLEKLVTPVTQGVHSAHPDELPLDRVAPGLRNALLREGSLARGVRELRALAPAGSPVAGIRGGMFRLVEGLVADLERYGVELRLRAVASEITETGVRVGSELLRGEVVRASPQEGAPSREVVLATLVVDEPRLQPAPRGTGVLVAEGARGIRARALTHVTTKWAWVAESAGGLQVLRLSYRERANDLREQARADAGALLGVDLTPRSVVDFARVDWVRPLPGAHSESGIHAVGEVAAGTGLAAVVEQAGRTAAEMIGVQPE